MNSYKFRIAGLLLCLIGAALLYGKDNVWLISLSITFTAAGVLSFLIGHVLFLLENHHGRDS